MHIISFALIPLGFLLTNWLIRNISNVEKQAAGSTAPGLDGAVHEIALNSFGCRSYSATPKAMPNTDLNRF